MPLMSCKYYTLYTLNFSSFKGRTLHLMTQRGKPVERDWSRKNLN